MADEEFDLFGDPVRLPNGKRGRPAHVACQKNRNKVIMLLALGWSNERIAAALHVSQPTLRRHYFSELKLRMIQRDRLDAYRFEKALEAVEGGNVGAMRLLGQMIQKNDLMLNTRTSPSEKKPASSKKSEPVGKKEAEKQAAIDIIRGNGDDDGWGDDLKPGQYN